MIKDPLYTEFAPAERASTEKILSQNRVFENDNHFVELFNSVPNFLLILNKERQTVFCNFALMEGFDIKNSEAILGERPGEIVDCIHSNELEGGCGTTKFCSTCGALKAILESQTGLRSTQECRLLVRKNGLIEAMDLRVFATPVAIENEDYSIFHFFDISDEKRRQILEKTFLHDISNTLGNVVNLSSLLPVAKDTETMNKYFTMLRESTDKLLREFRSQKELLYAENNELVLEIKKTKSLELLNQIRDEYSASEFAYKKIVFVSLDSANINIYTDPIILGRALGNLVKNGLEASSEGEDVSIDCYVTEKDIVFSVHNNCYIPEKIQLQLFMRSFSTKGQNRGLGTYSVKLLCEKYLKGEVWFETSKEKGTTFFIKVPISAE